MSNRGVLLLLVTTFALVFAGTAYNSLLKKEAAAVVRTDQLEESARRWEVPKVFPSGFKLQVEHPNNTDFLKYHVSVRVTPSTFEDIGTLISDTESPNRGLLRDLSEVNGVGKVILRPYEVIIEKGQMFDWHEMQPALETVIRQHLEPRQSSSSLPPPEIWGKTGTSEPHRHP